MKRFSNTVSIMSQVEEVILANERDAAETVRKRNGELGRECGTQQEMRFSWESKHSGSGVPAEERTRPAKSCHPG